MDEMGDILGTFSGTPGIESIEGIGVLFALIFFLILFLVKYMGYYRLLMDIAHFVYPNALVSAKGNPCIESGILDRLVEANDVEEVIDQLRKFGFVLDLRERASIDEIDASLETLYNRECDAVETSAPECMKQFFRSFCMMQEAEVIKRAIRLKHAGAAQDEIEAGLSPVGEISDALIRKMTEARDMLDLLGLLQNTAFGSVLADLPQEYSQTHAVVPIELALDRFVAEDLRACLGFLEGHLAPPATDVVEILTDISNITTVLRGKRDNLEMETIERYLMPPGYSLPLPMLKMMADSATVREAMVVLEKTRYRDPVEKAIRAYDVSGDLAPFETALDEYLLRMVLDQAILYHYGAGPLIKFIVAKKLEIKNIKAVVWGIHARQPADSIREMAISDRALV